MFKYFICLPVFVLLYPVLSSATDSTDYARGYVVSENYFKVSAETLDKMPTMRYLRNRIIDAQIFRVGRPNGLYLNLFQRPNPDISNPCNDGKLLSSGIMSPYYTSQLEFRDYSQIGLPTNSMSSWDDYFVPICKDKLGTVNRDDLIGESYFHLRASDRNTKGGLGLFGISGRSQNPRKDLIFSSQRLGPRENDGNSGFNINVRPFTKMRPFAEKEKRMDLIFKQGVQKFNKLNHNHAKTAVVVTLRYKDHDSQCDASHGFCKIKLYFMTMQHDKDQNYLSSGKIYVDPVQASLPVFLTPIVNGQNKIGVYKRYEDSASFNSYGSTIHHSETFSTEKFSIKLSFAQLRNILAAATLEKLRPKDHNSSQFGLTYKSKISDIKRDHVEKLFGKGSYYYGNSDKWTLDLVSMHAEFDGKPDQMAALGTHWEYVILRSK